MTITKAPLSVRESRAKANDWNGKQQHGRRRTYGRNFSMQTCSLEKSTETTSFFFHLIWNRSHGSKTPHAHTLISSVCTLRFCNACRFFLKWQPRWTTQIVFVIPLRVLLSFSYVYLLHHSVSVICKEQTHEPRTYYLFTNISMCLSLLFIASHTLSHSTAQPGSVMCVCWRFLCAFAKRFVRKFNTKTVLYECCMDIWKRDRQRERLRFAGDARGTGTTGGWVVLGRRFSCWKIVLCTLFLRLYLYYLFGFFTGAMAVCVYASLCEHLNKTFEFLIDHDLCYVHSIQMFCCTQHVSNLMTSIQTHFNSNRPTKHVCVWVSSVFVLFIVWH